MADGGGRPAGTPSALAPSAISPDVVRSFLSQLTKGGDVVDPTTWAESIPQVFTDAEILAQVPRTRGLAPTVELGAVVHLRRREFRHP